MSQDRKQEGLTALGNKTTYSNTYNPDVLEAFENLNKENDYWVRFNCPEFTTLCPITGQPDFAEIRISYIPDVKMVESKSLKLYLHSYRNHGGFHEDCVNRIMTPHAVASVYGHTQTTAVPVPDMRHWPSSAWPLTSKK